MIHGLTARSIDPHRIAAGDEPHQVEVVTTFFDKGSAGIGVEPVPVADLFEERIAMLTNGHHVQPADSSCLDFRKQALQRRHVAIFHRNPDRRIASFGFCSDCATLIHGHGQRLFDQHRPRTVDYIHHDLMMGVVRAGDQDGIYLSGGKQLSMMRIGAH